MEGRALMTLVVSALAIAARNSVQMANMRIILWNEVMLERYEKNRGESMRAYKIF